MLSSYFLCILYISLIISIGFCHYLLSIYNKFSIFLKYFHISFTSFSLKIKILSFFFTKTLNYTTISISQIPWHSSNICAATVLEPLSTDINTAVCLHRYHNVRKEFANAMKKKITIADISQKAGVSAATVSRVINHRSIVKPETVLQVEDAMSALGYVFEPTVPEVPSKKNIVLNLPEINNVFYREVIRGANTSAQAHGYDLLINITPINRNTIGGFCRLLHTSNVAGVILASCIHEDFLEQIQAIAPLIQCCEYNERSDCPYVTIDDVAAAEMATEYLLSCGRNKISLINGPYSFNYARKRQEGFLNVLQSRDIFVPQSWIVSLPAINFEMAYSAVCRLLNADPHPNAFFVISDVFAATVIRAAKKYNLKIPRDIMVVGFDNIDFSMLTTPSITTVSQPSFQEGYSSCELLVEMIQNPERIPKPLILNTELVIRESTASQ